MNIQTNRTNETIKKKVESFLGSIDNLTNHLNGDIFNFKNALKDCVQDIPNILEFSFNTGHLLERKKNIAIAKASLEQCKTYLSMLKSMRIVSTNDLIAQVEEINRLLESNQS
ncbi:hypothetical protein D9V87_08340 [Bacteroidetes/Chlorobi group bacterium MS-B_bin-24]|jgi:hypothetical protein|nr:MAG: hypothetical protein D9V87_08340 [Bacteroidetes/Chlorobi group bacterium MS-B_bin-24]